MPVRWETPPPEEGISGPAARQLGKVIHQERVGSMFLLRLRVPGWRAASPGQFAMVQPEGSARFLARAFSLHAQEGEDIAFLVAPVGPGTEELAQLDVGDRALVLGPLGRGFELALPALAAGADGGGAVHAGRLVVAAGGVGVAPFVLLLDALAQKRAAAQVLLLLGFRDDLQAEALHLFGEPAQVLRDAGADVRVEAITEDGKLGRAGLVTTLLRDELRPGDLVLACGAHAMGEAVWDLCLQSEVTAWFSLEAGMACGFGSCQGCMIETADGGLAKVCREGPVFSGHEVFGSARHPCALEDRSG
jgi:dihydroorotate dehydrogenase electron transfer subunit